MGNRCSKHNWLSASTNSNSITGGCRQNLPPQPAGHFLSKDNVMELQVVVFQLANEFFGIDIASVESIIKMQDITRLPQSPDFFEGIINLRGKILPVIDLRKRLNLSAMEKTLESRIVITSYTTTTLGLIVDQVEEVIDIDDSLVEPPPPITSSLNTEFIRGIAKTGQMLIILLDLEKVLRSNTAIQTAVLPV